jgi:hypothetical protein
MALADYADDDGRNCFPSQPRLAWKTGYTTKTIQRTIPELIAIGVVKMLRPATNKAPPRYELCLDMCEIKAPFQREYDDSGVDNLSTQDDSRPDNLSTQDNLGGHSDHSRVDILSVRVDKMSTDPIINLSSNQPDNEMIPFPEKTTEKAKAETARIWEVCRQELCGQSRGMSDWLPGSELLPTEQTRSGKPLYRLVVVNPASVQWLQQQAAGAITSRLLVMLGYRVALDIVADLPGVTA